MSEEQSNHYADKIDQMDRKIDRLTALIEGTSEDSPGVLGRLALVEKIMFGKDESREGLVYKVGMLWKVHLWVMCTLSGLAGFALSELARIIFHR